MLPKIAAVVVHHRNYNSIADVVEAILVQGVLPENLLVVDNSEEPAKQGRLRQMVNTKVEILFTANDGYGAAVNCAVDYFSARAELPEAFLVSTHEARPADGSVQSLWDALMGRTNAAVAGPTLVSGAAEQFVWSTGGYLNPVTHIPAHYEHRAPLDVLQGRNRPEPREWLDGAFLLYRWEDICAHRMPEQYFLYMEETDLHLSLGKAGRDVIWVPSAQVWQDSQGIPPYYFARNIRLLLRAHGGLIRTIFVPPVAVAKRIVADVVRGRGLANCRGYLKGLTARRVAYNYQRPAIGHGVLLINPLGAALHHYEEELKSVLGAAGIPVRAKRLIEPSSSGKTALGWLLGYLRLLVQARLAEDAKERKVLVLWPVLGYLDVVVLGLLGVGNASLVMHDPHPLVRSVGYSHFARRLASIWGSKVGLVAHSEKARAVISDHAPADRVTLLPHPILEPAEPAADPLTGERPRVRVLGQYKTDRDLRALCELSDGLSGVADLEVHGRRWPSIDGWTVVQGFVSEERLDELLTQSSVVVIPYKRFFQSGIAIRALELGTPFVGPKDSVLAEMVGEKSSLLVEEGVEGEWLRAVRHAIASGKEEARNAANRWRAANVDSWSEWAVGKRHSETS